MLMVVREDAMLSHEWAPCAWNRPVFLALVFFAAEWNAFTASAAPPSEASSSPTTSQTCEVRDFDILVDHKPTGNHRLTITSDGKVTTVQVESNVKIDFVVYVYTYKFRATEVWRENRLAQLDVRCEDGGKHTALTAKIDGETSRVTLNGRPQQTARGVMTTAYWKLPPGEDQTRTVSMLDVETGIAKPATIQRLGRTTLKVEGRPMTCRHFKVSGTSPAELWFDQQSRLVRQTSVEDGHPVELRLRRIIEQTVE